MKRKTSAPGEYEVGYGKPPSHTRFKPGQSGNPKGRPKRSQNLHSVFRDALFKKVPVTEDGRLRSMSRVEAIVTGLVAKALKGDPRAAESVLRLANQHFPPGEEGQPQIVLQVRDPYPDDDEDPWGNIRKQNRGAVGAVKTPLEGPDDQDSG